MPRTEYLAEAAAQFGHFLRLESDPLRLIFGFQPPDGAPENTDHPCNHSRRYARVTSATPAATRTAAAPF
jgi:hypothetical protein